MPKIRYSLAVAAALAATITLAACTSDAGSGSMRRMDHDGTSASPTASPDANTGSRNDSDIAFAMGMVPHHEQAIEMADMILHKDGVDQRVTVLARKIKDAQGPEITTMRSWLQTWGSPMDSMSGMPGMDSGTGMMSDSDMSALDAATGVEASKLFLQQMTQHHEGAIAMAKTEISSGENPDALTLATNIVAGQTAEITEMQNLLGSL